MTGKITSALIFILLACSFVVNNKQKINVVFIGDSITQGTRFPPSAPSTYAAEYLRLQKNLGLVQVANCGVSGYTTADFLPVSGKAYVKVKAAANGFYTNQESQLIFSVMLGTNDSAIKGPNGAPASPADYTKNIKTIADSLLIAYPTCKIILNHPIWYSSNTQNSGAAYLQEGQERVLLYHEEIDAIVNSYRRAKPGRVFKGDTQAYQYFQKNYLTHFKAETGPQGVFCLHPNQMGDKALGQFWAKAIIKVLY